MKPSFRKTHEEKMAESTQMSVATLGEVASKVDSTKRAIQDLHVTLASKDDDIIGFTGIIKEQKDTNSLLEEVLLKDESSKVVSKMEEVKSASLITNKLLKEIRDKEAPNYFEINLENSPIAESIKEPPVDTSKIENLLPKRKMEISLKGVSIMTLKGDKGDTPSKEELLSIITPLIPKTKGDRGENGKDGKDYVLTEKDKKDIAKKIEVPVVEKVVEKTEVIKEVSKENKGAVSFIIDGEKITAGVKGELEIPFSGKIVGLTLIGNTIGSIDIDILKTNFSSLPNYTSITGDFYPGIKEDSKEKYGTLSGWDTTITSGDILRFSVIKCSKITRLLISLTVTKYD